ncbi:MAG: nicotinate phosphoribosyltransferase [Sedimentisphaerales bacterium]|nr:nicotinate phosphoribosyltransferase [Sedimentisphaerales bacterium]
MWLIRNSPALFMDLYELTMARVYLEKQMNDRAYFEVTIRKLPEHWGFFVMAGLAEVESYLNEFHFTKEDIDYLRSTKIFSDDFLSYLAELRPEVSIRCLPEGTVFFPNEPVFELSGPLICAQILESYILNILGFSIIEATSAARISLAAKGLAVIDFGLRRSQGPVASLRSAAAARMAGFRATSNLFAARYLNFPPAGTMAHSFIEVHDSEEQSFINFAETYGRNAILLVDTYDSIEGIKKAAEAAKQIYKEKGVQISGIRIDSGDLVELSKFARKYFQDSGVDFLKIFVSGDLDEFRIADLLKADAQIDGFGIGTRFAVSRSAPSAEIVYKIIRYGDKDLLKTSPQKESRPGRKTITRLKDKYYQKDIVSPLQSGPQDLLQPFESAEQIRIIQERLITELSLLEDSVKAVRNPHEYPVEFKR